MKIPFLEEVPHFEPRTKIGVRKNMSIEQREILDAIDVIEQKADYGLKVGVRGNNMGVLLFVALVLTNGPSLLKIVQKMLGGIELAHLTRALGLLQ